MSNQDAHSTPDPAGNLDSAHFELEAAPPQPATPAPKIAPPEFNPTAAANAAIAEMEAKSAEDYAGRPLGPPIIPSTPALARPLLLVGIALVIAAMIATGVTSTKATFANIARMLYDTALHSALGVLAAWALARIEHRQLGDWREAWARTFVAVAALELCLSLNMGLLSTKLEEALVGVGAYFIILVFLMRWSAVRVLHLACLQFAAWGVLALRTVLHDM